MGESLINHLIYADDLDVLSPYGAGLQQLFQVCWRYGLQYGTEFNPLKSRIIITSIKVNQNPWFPSFCLGDKVLNVSTKVRYLSHIISNDLHDDDNNMNKEIIPHVFRWC